MNGERSLWYVAVCLYAMLGLLVYVLWQQNWSIGLGLAVFCTFYVGCAFGLLTGWVWGRAGPLL